MTNRAVLFASGLVFALSGCGSDSDDGNTVDAGHVIDAAGDTDAAGQDTDAAGPSGVLIGTFPIDSELAIGPALPRRASDADPLAPGDRLDEIVALFQDPGAQMFAWASETSGAEAIADELVTLGPIYTELFNSSLSSCSAWDTANVTIGEDAAAVLETLALRGELELVSDPDSSGALSADQHHRYDSVRYLWRLGCALAGESECVPMLMTLADATGDSGFVVDALWGGQFASEALSLDMHAMTLPHGAVGLHLLEQVMIPDLWGDPTVDSLDELVDAMRLCIVALHNETVDPPITIDPSDPCTAVGDAWAALLGAEGLSGAIVATVSSYACDELGVVVHDRVDQFRSTYTATTNDNVSLSTSTACPMVDGDADGHYDAFDTPPGCAWDALFTYPGETATPISGSFGTAVISP